MTIVTHSHGDKSTLCLVNHQENIIEVSYVKLLQISPSVSHNYIVFPADTIARWLSNGGRGGIVIQHIPQISYEFGNIWWLSTFFLDFFLADVFLPN